MKLVPLNRSRLALLGLLGALAACVQDAPSNPTPLQPAEGALHSQASASCENVRGTVDGNAYIPWGYNFAGDISGPGAAAVVELDPRGQGAIHAMTMHVIDTAKGMIYTTDQGVLAPVDPPVYRLLHRYTISGGTDAYANATGFLHPNVLVNIATGEFEGTYHGQLCH